MHKGSICFGLPKRASTSTIWVTGIQEKWKQEWEQKTGMGTCSNGCYSFDSLPMKFTELCKLSHKYSINFLSYSKRQPARNSISTDAIRNLLYLYNSFNLFNTHHTSMLIHSRLTIWLNLLNFPV